MEFNQEDVEAIIRYVKDEDFEGFKEILNKNPNLINATNEYGMTPFMMIAYYGDLEMVQHCLTSHVADHIDFKKKGPRKRDALDWNENGYGEKEKVYELLAPIYGVGVYPGKPLGFKPPEI